MISVHFMHPKYFSRTRPFKLSFFSNSLHVNKVSGVLGVKPHVYYHCAVIFLYNCFKILKLISVFFFVYGCVLLELGTSLESYATCIQ